MEASKLPGLLFTDRLPESGDVQPVLCCMERMTYALSLLWECLATRGATPRLKEDLWSGVGGAVAFGAGAVAGAIEIEVAGAAIRSSSVTKTSSSDRPEVEPSSVDPTDIEHWEDIFLGILSGNRIGLGNCGTSLSANVSS